MKKIEAIIRKTRFEDVKEALLAADIEWFSYYDVRGEGKMRQARIYRGVMYDTSCIERVLLNIVVRDKMWRRPLRLWSRPPTQVR
jgi:nitrogen regulatory protein P-II 1